MNQNASWYSTLLPIGFFILGLIFAIFPEFSIGAFVFFGVIQSLVKKKYKIAVNLHPFISIIFLTLVQFIYDLRVNQIPFLGLMQGIFIVLLYRSSIWIAKKHKVLLSFGLLFGLIMVSVWAAISIWFLEPVKWRTEPGLAVETQLKEYKRFEAVATGNAWVLQLLGMQGSGQVRYSAQFRSDRPIRLIISLLHEKLKDNRVDMPCNIQTQWTTCQIVATLPARAPMVFGFGGYGLWKRGSPDIEVRNEHLDIIEPPALVERISNASRAKLWAFNENALSVWLTVFGILAIGVVNNRYLIFPSGVFLILGIFTSGSRSALAAFVLGLFLLMIKDIKYFRAVLIATTFLLIALTATQIYQQRNTIISNPITESDGGFRAIQPNDSNSSRARLEIFRLAWLAFQDSPWFGVGDLQKAMIAKFDARAQKAGLTRQNLTHAHNLWLQVAGESGAFGLLAMVALWFVVFRRAWWENDRVALICLSVLFLVNLTDYFFYYAPVQIVFWMSAAGFLPRKPNSTEVVEDTSKSFAT
jgi:O-Antigen ligase